MHMLEEERIAKESEEHHHSPNGAEDGHTAVVAGAAQATGLHAGDRRPSGQQPLDQVTTPRLSIGRYLAP